MFSSTFLLGYLEKLYKIYFKTLGGYRESVTNHLVYLFVFNSKSTKCSRLQLVRSQAHITVAFDSRTVVPQGTTLVTQNAENPRRSFCILGDVVEDVRTVFERLGDTSIYIPTFV